MCSVHAMNLFTQVARASDAADEPSRPLPDFIEIIEPQDCSDGVLPPEGNVKLRNYRLIEDNLRAYTPTGDVHTSPAKGKLVSRYEVCATISPPRAKILELVRPEDPHRDSLEAIVKPAPRRGLARPLDEDTRRFLQRALMSPSPQGLSAAVTPEPTMPSRHLASTTQRSLADELREAEENTRLGSGSRRDVIWEYRRRSGDAVERERLGRLALSVEDEEEAIGGPLRGAARRLDALLAESRNLHDELAEIHEDIQVLARRVGARAS